MRVALLSSHYAEYSSRLAMEETIPCAHMVDLPLDARILDLGGGAGGTSPKRT